MASKAQLVAELDRALALGRAGHWAETRACLDAVARDPGAGALGPLTAAGLPRKIHSLHLKLAKMSGDLSAVAGLRATAVPPPGLLDDLFPADTESRAAMVAAAGQPVPKVLHQIWIGGPPPPACAAWRDWAGRHGWSYRLWDEAALSLAGVTHDPVWQAMRAAGDLPGAVDVARYHILRAEGGLYLDCDWYPARPDLPPHTFLPATGLSALAEAAGRLVGGESLLLSNALIAAPPDHPAMSRLIAALAAMRDRLPQGPAWWVTGPLPFTLAARLGPVGVLDRAMVAGHLPRGAPLSEAQAMAARNAAGAGVLIAWKSW